MFAVLVVNAAAMCYTDVSDQPIEISANRWFNPHTIRVPEERTYVLLFFSTVQNKDETGRYIARLGKLQRKSDVVVMGLSAESSKRVGSFVKKHGIRFPVGAESKAYKKFRIKKFPALVVLDFGERATGGVPSTWSLDQLDEYGRRASRQRRMKARDDYGSPPASTSLNSMGGGVLAREIPSGSR